MDCLDAGSYASDLQKAIWEMIETYNAVPMAHIIAAECFQSKFSNCELTRIYGENRINIDRHHKDKYLKAAKGIKESTSCYVQGNCVEIALMVLVFTVLIGGLAIPPTNRKTEKPLDDHSAGASKKTPKLIKAERFPVELADTQPKDKSNRHYPKLIVIAVVGVILLFSPALEDQNFGAATPVLRILISFVMAFVIGSLGVLMLRHPEPSKPTHYAATWFGGMFFLCSILRLPSFFDTLDIEYLAQFGIVITVFGSVTYLAGYAFGRYKISN